MRVRLILIKGAGSPAEINLREGDIANMGFPEVVNCPVVRPATAGGEVRRTRVVQ